MKGDVIVILQFGGGLLFEDVATTAVNCSVLEGVECAGDRIFIKTDVPCVRLVIMDATIMHGCIRS